jgi:DNA-binding response OmpR family regulator
MARATRLLRVLIVDPFLEEAEMYRDFLRHEGLDASAVTDAARALDVARASRPDVLVARLPQGDPTLSTLDLLRLFRAHAATRHKPVLVLATSIELADREAALAAGCDSYVMLPFDPEALSEEVRRLACRPPGDRRAGASQRISPRFSAADLPRARRRNGPR